MSDKVRMAQYGTKHSHAGGVLEVMLANPDVEVVGVYEPDPERRRTLRALASRRGVTLAGSIPPLNSSMILRCSR